MLSKRTAFRSKYFFGWASNVVLRLVNSLLMPINVQIKDDAGRFEDAKNYLDTVFPFMLDHGDFDLYDVICDNRLQKLEGLLECQHEMRRIMIDLGYAVKGQEFKCDIALTQKGRDAKKAGGHLKYQKRQRKINYEKWTFWIGVVVATLLALVSILLSLKKS